METQKLSAENTAFLRGNLNISSKLREEERKARKSPFSEFYQVNRENSHFLRNCLEENPTALKLLFFIFDNMDNFNSLMCSYAVFEELLDISASTVRRSIKYLKDKGFIYVHKSGSSNIYVANKNLVWNSWGNNWKYCKFPVNVILSSSEQSLEEIQKHKNMEKELMNEERAKNKKSGRTSKKTSKKEAA